MQINQTFIQQIDAALRAKTTDALPEITLEYNPQKSSYSTVEHEDSQGRYPGLWRNMDDHIKAIRNNTIWRCVISGDQHTPALNYNASDLQGLLMFFGEFDQAETQQLETQFKSMLNGEYANFSFTFNGHVTDGTHVNEWIGFADSEYENAETDEERVELGGFVSMAEYLKVTTEQNMWYLQCYARTPVGFYVLRASSLVAIIAATE